MRIAADGTWFYQGTPISRPALVKLFASILKREGERYFLVTPVEKCGILVEDAPFMAVGVLSDQGETRRRIFFPPHVDDWGGGGGGPPPPVRPDAAAGGRQPYIHI